MTVPHRDLSDFCEWLPHGDRPSGGDGMTRFLMLSVLVAACFNTDTGRRPSQQWVVLAPTVDSGCTDPACDFTSIQMDRQSIWRGQGRGAVTVRSAGSAENTDTRIEVSCVEARYRILWMANDPSWKDPPWVPLNFGWEQAMYHYVCPSGR